MLVFLEGMVMFPREHGCVLGEMNKELVVLPPRMAFFQVN
jgi:hypothetical protein